MSEKPSSSRRTLWLIGALCIAPVVASYVAYYFLPPGGQTNHGELVTVPPLPNASLRLLDGTPFESGGLRGKWVLLMADSAQCGEACQRKLFTMRQLRLAQGREMERVERVWLVSDDAAVAPQLSENFSGTRMLRAGASILLAALPADRAVTEYLYVIDPLGNVVLRYASDAEPRRMIKDISRLLKTSRIG